MTTTDKLRAEEHAQILRQCAEQDFDMAACEAMSFEELRTMWSDWLSDFGDELAADRYALRAEG